MGDRGRSIAVKAAAKARNELKGRSASIGSGAVKFCRWQLLSYVL